jgi:hypothetical protein
MGEGTVAALEDLEKDLVNEYPDLVLEFLTQVVEQTEEYLETEVEDGLSWVKAVLEQLTA